LCFGILLGGLCVLCASVLKRTGAGVHGSWPVNSLFTDLRHNRSIMRSQTSGPGAASTDRIIGLGIKIHRKLGPGLLESVYHQCLCWELRHAGLDFAREVPLPVVYEDMRMERAFQADIIVEGTVLLELKAVEHILPVHRAQTLTYLRLSGCAIGLLMNFNVALLKDGLHRFIP
jgi:GxxExxY protein